MHKALEPAHISRAAKIVAALFSVGTAGVTIFTFARSYGLIGVRAPAVLTVGTLGVSWVSLTPAVDTATSLGDTVRLAATVTDDNGTALLGATIRWSSDDPHVAEPIGGGKVVARGSGVTTLVATVGDKLARAHVIVRQRIASVHLNGDSTLTMGEDEHRRLSVRALDARGNWIPGLRAAWHSLDSSVVSIDSAGVATAHAQGMARISADIDGVAAQTSVSVAPLPGSLEVLAGDAQRAVAGATLARPVAVRLLSTRGQPIPGLAVRFRTAEGRGAADPAVVVTDSHGVARTSWTLASVPGRQRMFAINEHLDSAAVITAEAEPVATNTRVTLLQRSIAGRAGMTVADTVRLAVADTLGRTLADVPIEWTAEDGGRVVAVSERTDSLGEARAVWTLGPASGEQHVRVRVGNGRSIPAVAVAARALAGPAAAIVSIAGDAQKARVGTALPRRIVLRAVDSLGNPVPGVVLSCRPTAGELADTAIATDSAGLAHITWTMPRSTGAQRLAIRAPGIARALELTATALAAPAANVIFTEPKGEPVAGKHFGKSVDVTVTDVYGNPVENALVLFKSQSGSVGPAKIVTDAAGVARTHWILGTKPGDQTLTASLASGASGVRSALTVHVNPGRSH